jgi:hypothetical protein
MPRIMLWSRPSRRIWACKSVPININSGSYSSAKWWTGHLKNAKKNELVQIMGFYGLSAETIEDAFSEMHGMARASKKCTNFFSQYNINPRADEHLTEAQWEAAHELHRKNHGLDHLPYFRVRHIKGGRIHEHGIALRVDPETGKAISDSLTAPINERTSRELEISFGLERGQSILVPNRELERPDRRPKKHEKFRAERTGIDPETVKAEARAVWRSADNAASFRAGLEASGAYVLARGDRRGFVIIDQGGGDHSLARAVGVKTAEVRARMEGIDPASLPTVDEARAQQKARAADRQHQQQPDIAAGKTPKMEPKQPANQNDAPQPGPFMPFAFDTVAGEITEQRPHPYAATATPDRESKIAAQEPLQAVEPFSAPPTPEQQPTTSGEAHSPAPRAFAHAAVDDFLADAQAALGRAERVSSRFLAGIAERIEAIIHFLSDIFAPPPKLTRNQAERAVMVADERAQENADLAAYFNNEAARDRLLDGIRIDDAEVERQERVERGGDNRERDW